MNTPASFIGQRVLFLGAHADDIEIGCGGTAAKLAATGRAIAWAQGADCGPGRRQEAATSAALLGLAVARNNLFFGLIPDGRLEERKDVLRNWLGDLAERFAPDTVFVHRGDDSHPDHVALYEGVIRHFVHHTVLLYPIPKLAAQATPFQPNYYEDITEFMGKKLQGCACHVSQAGKGIYLDPEHLRSVARVAYQSGFSRTGGFAEAFLIHVARSAAGSPPVDAPATPPKEKPAGPGPAPAPESTSPTPGAPLARSGPAKASATKRRPRRKSGGMSGVVMNIGTVHGNVIGKKLVRGNEYNDFRG